MELSNLNWTSIALSAVVVAFAATSAYFLSKKYKSNTVFWVSLIILYALGKYITTIYVKPYLFVHEAETNLTKQMEDNPFYRELYNVDPVAHEQFKSAVLEYVSNGKSELEAFIQGRPIVTKVITDHIPYSSNENIISYAQLDFEVMQRVGEISSKECWIMINPAQQTLDESEGIISSEYNNVLVDWELFAAILHNAHNAPVRIPTFENFEPIAKKVLNNFASLNEGYLEVLENIESPDIDKKKACDAILDFNKSALSLPLEESALFYRYTYADTFLHKNVDNSLE